MSSRKPKFPGILNQPIVWPVGNALLSYLGKPDEEAEKKQLDCVMEQYHQRVLALYEHYDIKPERGSGLGLALALARDCVPGFQVLYTPKRGRGRPPRGSGTAFMDLPLCFDVLLLVRRGQTTANACRILAKRSEYVGTKAGTLRRRFYSAMKDGRVADAASSAVVGYLLVESGAEIPPE
jgi:hypothetical protein